MNENLRELVLALIEGNDDKSIELFHELIKAKTICFLEDRHVFRAARRHHRAGSRDMRKRVNMARNKRAVVDASKGPRQRHEIV